MVQVLGQTVRAIRAFGTATFIRDYLAGRGPDFGVESIDPGTGAAQADVFAAYKSALQRAMAEDLAVRTAEDMAREAGRAIEPAEVEQLTAAFLERIHMKQRRMRYASFRIYFGVLKRLGWVEPTGETEPSTIQDAYPEGPARVFYRLTGAGLGAGFDQLRDPLKALYGFDREQRSGTTAPPAPSEPTRAATGTAGEVPTLELPERAGKPAIRRLIRHLGELAELDPEAPEVAAELERLEGAVEGWLDSVDDAIGREEEKDSPNDERLDLLKEQQDALQEAQTALGDQAAGDAITALERLADA